MLLACVIYKAFVGAILIPSCLYLVGLPLLSGVVRTDAQYIHLRHSVHLVVALFDTVPNTVFNSYFNRVRACKL